MAPNIYFTEIGLVSYLLGLETPSQVARDPLIGGIFENMVVSRNRMDWAGTSGVQQCG